MDTYVLLLDQITPFLESQSSEIPKDMQEKISLAGMGEETEEVYDGVEEFDYAVIEKNSKVLDGIEAKEIEGEGIRKGKGIRTKIKSERYYIWDKFSALQREYKIALYDFHHYPNHKENAASEKLAKSIKLYLNKKFSELPHQMKMNIAFVDIFQKWNEISREQREYLARDFDARMQPNFERTVNQYCDWELERLSIPDQILFWQKLNPQGVASEQIIIDYKIKEFEKREVELEKLLSYSDSGTEQESSIKKEGNKRINHMRAFLQSCFSEGIEKNIESVWQHIRKNAGVQGFQFETASKDTATTIDGKSICKKNLKRCLAAFIKE